MFYSVCSLVSEEWDLPEQIFLGNAALLPSLSHRELFLICQSVHVVCRVCFSAVLLVQHVQTHLWGLLFHEASPGNAVETCKYTVTCITTSPPLLLVIRKTNKQTFSRVMTPGVTSAKPPTCQQTGSAKTCHKFDDWITNNTQFEPF